MVVPDHGDSGLSAVGDVDAVGGVDAAGDDRPAADFRQSFELVVNGQPRIVEAPPWATLLDVLRERLGLCGTKKGCDHGLCGACTVHVDGRRVVSCLTLAVAHAGADVRTIESVAGGGNDGDGVDQDNGVSELHPMQSAFIEQDAFQCGYCTPGQIMSALGYLQEGGVADRQSMAEGITNQCRCGCYQNIIAAVAQAAEQMPQQPSMPSSTPAVDRP